MITRLLPIKISDQRSTVAPSDSDRDCSSGQRDPDNRPKWPPGAGLSTNPAPDSESGGSQPPSPKAGRKRQASFESFLIGVNSNHEVKQMNNNEMCIILQRLRNHCLTSLCLLSHHPFFTLFRECLVVLKKLIDACHENSSPERLGASRQTFRLIHLLHSPRSNDIQTERFLEEYINLAD